MFHIVTLFLLQLHHSQCFLVSLFLHKYIFSTQFFYLQIFIVPLKKLWCILHLVGLAYWLIEQISDFLWREWIWKILLKMGGHWLALYCTTFLTFSFRWCTFSRSISWQKALFLSHPRHKGQLNRQQMLPSPSWANSPAVVIEFNKLLRNKPPIIILIPWLDTKRMQ